MCPLSIKIYEGLVRPILPMIFCKNFRQPSRPFFHFDCVSFIVVTCPMMADRESRTTHRAHFKRLDRERCGARQFLVGDGHRIENFIRDSAYHYHDIPRFPVTVGDQQPA